MDVISNQSHDDGPGDHESPVLQFEAQELRSNGKRACDGFQSKRHGSARKSPKELENRRQQQRAASASPLLSAGTLAGDVCHCPDDEEPGTKNAEALGITEGIRKERRDLVAANLSEGGQASNSVAALVPTARTKRR